MKLKLSRPDANDPNAPSPSVPSTPQASTPGGAGGGFKLKLKTSQPPTPVTESGPLQPSAPLAPPPIPLPKVKRQYNKKPKDAAQTKKRPADDDISPAPKRPVTDKANRRVSLKINSYQGDDDLAQPGSAGPKLKLSARKQSTGPKVIALVSRKAPPKRPVGVGYDSEASDAEADPLIEEQFILRMQPGDDCDYLREAIANRTIGLRPDEGGASVTMKFLDKELRRNMITIRGTNYAATLVDLPCIIEGMKSWDKRGWWKVADICQMLLVLGPTENEATAKSHALPKEVDKSTFAYAHGLTPPMHWVRKRRFRKRASYRSMEHIDDEVERLIKADLEAEKSGGGPTRFEIKDLDARPEDAQEEYYDDGDDEPPSGFIDTTEDGFGQAYPAEEEDEEAEEDLEAMLAAEFAAADDDADADADADAEVDDTQVSITIPAAAITDPAAVFSVETPSSNTAAPDTSSAPTPAAEATEASSDEDEEEEEDDYDEEASPDAVDEDLVTKQAELAEQRSQVEDLEREVETARVDYERQKNALLKQRALNKLKSLRDELAMKKRTFGMDDGEEEE